MAPATESIMRSLPLTKAGKDERVVDAIAGLAELVGVGDSGKPHTDLIEVVSRSALGIRYAGAVWHRNGRPSLRSSGRFGRRRPAG